MIMEDFKVTVLAGGVGGAKLSEGFAQIWPKDNLSIIVNTGDDFKHLGLKICPDLDTVMYTLAGVANPETGWGRSLESWRSMEEVKRLGGPDWFSLGDLDLATHLTRSHLLSEGLSLTEVTGHLSRHFGVETTLLPMSDQAAPTIIATEEGEFAFQTWFVERQWQPAVTQIVLPENIQATAEVVNTLSHADVLIIAPSNPFVSIDPILNVYPLREMVNDLPELVVAVSPIIAGKAVKGPAAKMMRELGMPVTSTSIAHYYEGMVDLFVCDISDEVSSPSPDLEILQVDTLMLDGSHRRRLAHDIAVHCRNLLGK